MNLEARLRELELVKKALTRATSLIEYEQGRQPWVDEALSALESSAVALRRLSELEQALIRIKWTPLYRERGNPSSGISAEMVRAIREGAALVVLSEVGGQDE